MATLNASETRSATNARVAPPSVVAGAAASLISWVFGGVAGWTFARHRPAAPALHWVGVAVVGSATVLTIYAFWWRRRSGRPVVAAAVWPALAAAIALNGPFAVLVAWILRLVDRVT